MLSSLDRASKQIEAHQLYATEFSVLLGFYQEVLFPLNFKHHAVSTSDQKPQPTN